MIHVCFGVYDKDGRYSKFTGTAIASVFENVSQPPSVTVHILHDNTMTQDNHDKFVYLAGQYGQQIKFYNVEKLCANKITRIIEMIPAIKTARTTIGTLFSLLIPDIIPLDVNKILYLDSDIIVNLDIKDFWEIDLGDKPLAAVEEGEANTLEFRTVNGDSSRLYPIVSGMVAVDEYFNAGVMLFNLSRLRTEKDLIMNGIKLRAENTKSLCFDQDIWNYSFAKKYLHIPNRFNQFVARVRRNGDDVKDAVYHFSGGNLNESVKLDMNDPFNRLYFKYFTKTPWFNSDIFGRIYDTVCEDINRIKKEYHGIMLWLSKVMSGKQRAFFTHPSNIDALKIIFGIEEDEEIVSAVNDTSVNQLIDSIKKSKGRNIYIILIENFPSVHAELTSKGFIEGEDFINGNIFFAEVGGIHTHSYKLIKAM